MRAVPFARRPRAHCPSPSAFPVAVLEHTHSHCTHTSRRRAGAGRTREEWPSPRLALNQFARPQNGLISAAAVPISGDRSRLGLSLSLNSTRLNRFIRNARSAAQQESFIVCSGLVHCTVDEEYFLSGPHNSPSPVAAAAEAANCTVHCTVCVSPTGRAAIRFEIICSRPHLIMCLISLRK